MEGNETFSFVYDVYGNVIQTKVGNVALSTNTYGSYNGLLQSSLYANGDGIKYVYDKMGNVSMIYRKHDTNTAFDIYSSYFWRYASDGTPLLYQDGPNQLRYEYAYDSIGRLIRQDMSNSVNSAYVGSVEFGYDNRNYLSKITNAMGSETLTQNFTYTVDGLPEKYTTSKGQAVLYHYDSLNRLTGRDIYFSLTQNPVIDTSYTYFASKQGTGYTTTNLKTETIKGTEYKYTYDYLWNTKAILKGGAEYKSYEYDLYGQLTRENNKGMNKSVIWEYDKLGNIKVSKTYAYGTATPLQNETEVVIYNYGTDTDAGWNKLLKSLTRTTYHDDNTTTTTTETIDYDAIGNPISYRGATMGWYGRQMTSYFKNGTSITNTYDAEGIRGSKTVNGSKTTYQYINGKLYYEKRGDGRELYYLYDSQGYLTFIRTYKDGSIGGYYVATNAQGDVIGLYTNAGVEVARYEYDAWGNATVWKINADGQPVDITNSTEEHIGTLNPIRYRGYYYDVETGFYLTGTRYYDPEIGRFINADSVISGTGESVQGYNLFAYCFNNPVNMSDPSGNWPKWATKLVAAVAVVAVVAAVAAVTVATAGAGTAIAAVAVGAAKGATIGFAVGAASGAAIGYATTGMLEGTLNGMADGALSGSISGAITGGVQGYSNYSNYTSARNFLKNNGQNPDEVMSCFKGTPKVKTLKTDTTVYRTWGGTTQELGHWVSPNNYGSSARNLLSLPAGNTMAHTSSFLLPKGTTVLAGKAAPLFGQSGGGVQWWISVLG